MQDRLRQLSSMVFFSVSLFFPSISSIPSYGALCSAYLPKYAFDGKTGGNQRWISAVDDKKPWIVVDTNAQNNLCAFNVVRHDFEEEGFAECGHSVSIWVGDDNDADENSLHKSPDSTDNWKTVIAVNGHDGASVEHNDLDEDVRARFVRFDFDKCNHAYVRIQIGTLRYGNKKKTTLRVC